MSNYKFLNTREDFGFWFPAKAYGFWNPAKDFGTYSKGGPASVFGSYKKGTPGKALQALGSYVASKPRLALGAVKSYLFGEPTGQSSTWDLWCMENPTYCMAAKAASLAGVAAGAYHGYKRNSGSVGWAIGWALLGGMFPFITVPVSLAQGFGKPA